MRAAAGGTGEELGAEFLHRASKKLNHIQAGTEPTRKRTRCTLGKHELSWERGWQWEETDSTNQRTGQVQRSQFRGQPVI